jgi:hypothetical protein
MSPEMTDLSKLVNSDSKYGRWQEVAALAIAEINNNAIAQS